MLNKIFGIDYNLYACGSIGGHKLVKMGQETRLFYTVSEMLKMIAELKKDNIVGEIKPFIAKLNREDYRI